ncbi:MAG: NFACT family protein [Bacteroidetes bacterium]|nr:NFACT family protein [Bacteroidota bacterium]
MFTNWLTYCRIAEELDAQLRGTRISEVYTQQKNELVIDVASDAGTRSLVFSTLPRLASLQLKEDFARARKNSLDLLPDLVGDRITRVAIAGSDRIIRFSLASGRGLYALLFPVRANLLLYDGPALVDSYKQYDIGADVLRQDYEALAAPPTLDELRASISYHDNGLGPALRALHPWLSGRFAEELFHRSGIPKDSDASACSAADLGRLQATLSEMLEEADTGTSRVYLDEQRPVAFSLVRMTHLTDLREERFDSALEGVGYFLRRHFSGGDFTLTRDRLRKTVLREVERIDRVLEKLASPATLKKQADEYEKFGNLLMIHLYDMPTQPGSMIVPDIFVDPRLVVTIPLKPRTTVLENAQMYFGKAQSTRASIEYVISRKASMEKRKTRLSAFLTAIDAAADSHILKELFKEYTAIMEELGLTAKGEKNEAPFPFRRFVVEGGFEVWAGKNSANNDLLTVRHSRPNDLWFHARGVGGSHVVIKVGSAAGEPSKEAIRQAASIAAYYSKHRNAKRVPVAYTEKKYVRKPRGAAPGSVAVEREKVIMVDPRLPEGAKDED